ncbi:MAG: stress response translation initiation inhibitor YciH [Desulfurococcales archaeon ex4484_204]|nr:MAG: stress response translation initiation inhibitor YciH [Desulfurococcales archaeon ex4484_204]
MGRKGRTDIEALCGGLPEELCIQLGAEQQLVKIKIERRKFGKEVTVIEGLDPAVFNLKRVASTLKSKLATGGTVKNNHIELQGDHRSRVKTILINEFGIPPDNIIFIEAE